MRQIMLINSKGGCGKTTIATNLAGYYASKGIQTTLLDHDPQGSSLNWNKRRSFEQPQIKGIDGARPPSGVTKSWLVHGSGATQLMVIDTPAGVNRDSLFDLVKQADDILIPVMPSPIDTHAVARFIQDLLLVGKARGQGKRIGIIANRVREGTKAYQQLELFLAHLKIPVVARLRDTHNYVAAMSQGLDIHNLHSYRKRKDLEQWKLLLDWLDVVEEKQALSQRMAETGLRVVA